MQSGPRPCAETSRLLPCPPPLTLPLLLPLPHYQAQPELWLRLMRFCLRWGGTVVAVAAK